MAEQMTGTLYVDTGGGFEKIGSNAEFTQADPFEAVNQSAKRIAAQLRETGKCIKFAMKVTETAMWILSAVHWESEIGEAWKSAHPGRRLPGSMRNRRLAKKRAQYLERWAREVGL